MLNQKIVFHAFTFIGGIEIINHLPSVDIITDYLKCITQIAVAIVAIKVLFKHNKNKNNTTI